MENKKKKLGQFYTTNYEYILQNFKIPKYAVIIEPFTGNGDLLKILDNNNFYVIESYDIDPKHNYTLKRDTIKNPPNYNGKFILTNPPYLARNKSIKKSIFDRYNVNDLYKCFIKELITNKALGGIIIIPLNFFSSIRSTDINLRKEFLEIYDIIQLNIFEERVFSDTSYTVCSFQFKLKIDNKPINIDIYPSKINIKSFLNRDNNYTIGGEIYNLRTNNIYKITRATINNKNNLNTNILVKCIDDNEKNQISLSYVSNKDRYIDETPNLSSRTYATLIIEPSINIDKQKELIDKFNKFLLENRNKYHSLFLTNYRESKDIARKRISFDLVYSIVEYILEKLKE